MCCAILVALKRRLVIAIPAITLMTIGLALAQYRAVWAATALGVVLIVLARPNALRPSNIAAAVAVVLVLSCTAFVPEIQDAILKRAETLNTLSTDVSFEDRLSQYERLSSDDELIVGIGLGLNGSARKMDDLPRLVIDGGLIEILLVRGRLGWPRLPGGARGAGRAAVPA